MMVQHLALDKEIPAGGDGRSIPIKSGYILEPSGDDATITGRAK